MNFPLLSRLTLHLSACVAYPFVSYFGFWSYQNIAGTPVARGVDIGIAMQLIFYGFIIMNLMMIGMRRVVPRLILLGAALLGICLYLLPEFPLRALGTVAMFGSLGLFAICASNWLELKLSTLVRNKTI
ncbi:hypothetical protein PMM47T1_28326 [Pseudomonas sp. M47T1]|uniref:hypothetical protein n=1 Tax=Pseudomonas sp. M47T1 TaxID=1179778 RepID=UPI00026086BE|nr:hypothetical protein [Pseudomonas sp. M47T1]EIK93174.1 hypothetical protein PMM47T1_28326 [Pseudomonas sp. M47T1]